MARKKSSDKQRQMFVTSDLWLGRNNAIDLYNRPFKNIEDMNNTIIERWNTTVGNDDIVFVLGNFMYSGTHAQTMITELKGCKVLLATENDKTAIRIDPKIIDEILTYPENIHLNDVMMFYDHIGVASDNDTFDELINMSEKAIPEMVIMRTGIFDIPQYGIVLSNYPLLDWNGKDNGSINIHGGRLETSVDVANDARVSARTDFWDFCPVNMLHIKKIVEIKRNGGLL